jgi:gamma-glutamylcyclotransferase (GGCT)/AIG2-like uncharacterized protein YtfP
LFVYGTLRSGGGTEWSRRLASHAGLIGTGRVMGSLFEIGSYPGMTPALCDGDWVVGELFELRDPESFWPPLDEYEGHEFERREVPVCMDDGRWMNGWVYYYRGDTEGKLRIAGGDWLRR